MAVSSNITIDDSDIAWESDVEHKFKNMDIANWQSKQWLDVTNRKYSLLTEKKNIEHFIVWMRTAGLPNFRKLYGKID